MDRTIAHYNLLERIGEGPLGEVFRSRDTRAGRTVALKVLPPPADAAARQALLDDARTAATLSHPNIATPWDVGEDDGVQYLAYEFASGISLAQEIGGRPVNARRAVELAVQLADALADAHARGILHGDLRPDTIVITSKGSAKLLDFGMARWTRGGAIRARAAAAPDALGPDAQSIVAYLSPEQALGGLVDGRTDVFSLGVILYEMLTGKPAFPGSTPTDTVLNVTTLSPTPPSSVNPDVLPELDGIVARALTKDIESRLQSAAAFSAELRSVGAMLDVRSGDLHGGPGELLPLDEEPGTAKWWALGLGVAAVTAAVVWWLMGA